MLIERVTTRQIIGFIIISRFSFAISSMPAINLPPNNQDQWVMIAISFLYIIVFSTPLLFLANRFNEFSMLEYMKKIYGETLGKIIGMFYGLFFMANVIDSLTLQTELVSTSILTDSSIFLITVTMWITCMYIASRGVITIFRGSDLFGPITSFIFIGLLLLGLPNVDFSFIFPMLKDSSFIDINNGAMRLSLLYSDIFLLTMIIPELENKKDINKIFIKVILGVNILLIISVIVTQGALGIQLARHSVFPFLIYTRLINFVEIFERIDSAFVLVWIITSTARITGFIYISTRVYRDIFNKKEDEKVIIFFVGLIIFIVSMYISRARHVVGIRKDFDLYMNILSIIFFLSIPTLTCIVYFFRRKSIEKKEKSEN